MEQSKGPRRLSGDELAVWLAHLQEADPSTDAAPIEAADVRVIHDSSIQDGMAVRSLGQATASRQLAYATAVGDVALSIVSFPRQELVEIHGQFLEHQDLQPGQVQARLIRDGATAQSAEADDLGEFSFAAVPPGQYRLLLKVSQVSILIPMLDLAA